MNNQDNYIFHIGIDVTVGISDSYDIAETLPLETLRDAESVDMFSSYSTRRSPRATTGISSNSGRVSADLFSPSMDRSRARTDSMSSVISGTPVKKVKKSRNN